MSFTPKSTEAIDKLFLELSQFTRAVTERELKLASTLLQLMNQCPESMQQCPQFLEAWDNAVMAIDCFPQTKQQLIAKWST